MMRDKVALAISMAAVWGSIWGWMYLMQLLHNWLMA